MKPDDDAYTDYRVHYETCPRCGPFYLCDLGVKLRQRELQRRERKGKR